MTTAPLGENPYLYQGGPTVPLRQQKTGAYAANSFGNRVFYTPEGALPNSTLAPGLAPTPGALLRQNLSGAGLAGAAIGGALQAQAAYSQGAGLFEGVGSGVGSVAGAIGGQFAGAAAGSAVGGAAGSAIPGVGNVAGAGAGTVAGTIGGGLAGGAVGGSVGGGLGRAVDNFFWPDPAEPGTGIPQQPDAASPRPSGTEYPGQFPAGAGGAGPVVSPEIPAPFEGMQSPTLYVVYADYSFRVENCSGGNVFEGSETKGVNGLNGPIVSISQVDLSFGDCGVTQKGLKFTNAAGGFAVVPMAAASNHRFITYSGVSGRGERADGLPDTGGNAPPIQSPVSAPNPYRPNGTDGRGQPRTVPPAPSARPAAPSPNTPWPERPASPVPDTAPLSPDSPFSAPEPGPGFAPAPTTAPTAPTAPRPPTDPLNPANPGQPIEEERRPARPFFIPIPIPTQSFNRPDFKDPDVPVSIPVNFRQPAITPTGDPNQLINPTTTTTPNPNTKTEIAPVQQPARIEEGKCCIPPANPEIMKALNIIRGGIGVSENNPLLPASVPTQIAQKNTGQRSLSSLAELQVWAVQQLDGVVGQWPIEIGVDTPGGNVGLSIPNMAEAIAEQMGLLIGQQVTSAQILNTASRTLAQSGSATQQAHLAHLTAKANADFLGYENRTNAVDIPLAYTPGLSPFDGLLNESTAKIQGFQNTDGTDIKAIFAELLQAAAIIRAVYWRKLDAKGDLKTQIRQNIRGQSDFIDEAAAGGGNDSDWEAYLKQVAEGFKGVTGDANPYNRPPTEGPQIKDRSPGEGKT